MAFQNPQSLSTTTYLETFVESTVSLPPELQRILNTIKALDDKCLELSDIANNGTQQLLSLPPQQPGPADENRRVEQAQRMLLQFCEEKVQLAQQAFDLLELHALDLEKSLENFETELKAAGLLDNEDGVAGLETGGLGDFYTPGSLANMETSRGRTPKLEDWTAPTPTEPAPLPAVPAPAVQQVPGSLKRTATATQPKGSQKKPRPEDALPAAANASGK